LLAGSGAQVGLLDVDQELMGALSRDRENKKYLPGLPLNETISIVETQAAVTEGADFLVLAVPTQHFRTALTGALPYMAKNAVVVNVAKGIELGTLKTPSMIFEELAEGLRFATLSGPSHAEEVAAGMPTTVTVASASEDTAKTVQDVFMTGRFRVYTQSDVIGVELGGATKNVIALGAGISDGMGYGDNTKAALMTRGITEMARLGVCMGARRETFFGLSGIGDLIVTCTSQHSRNRRCGILIGEGVPPKEAIARIGMVVEGITTAEAARDLAIKLGVEMPITESICRIVSGEVPPETELTALMTRRKKHEHEELPTAID
jgi:glycerol-3-phosphate dehydrogenase (NAD(P)+)